MTDPDDDHVVKCRAVLFLMLDRTPVHYFVIERATIEVRP